MRMRSWTSIGVVVLGFFALGVASPTLPPTPVRTVVDEYHGIKVSDPYRWLEQSNDPDVKKWTSDQAEMTRHFLDQLPHQKEIQTILTKWNNFESASYFDLRYEGGTYFTLRLNPPKNQPELIVLKSLDNLKGARILVDPNAIDAGGTTTIDFFEPSLDGKYVAVSLSKNGSEEGSAHVYQVTDGKELGDLIPLVTKPTGGGSIAWNSDATGFYYTRYPQEGERPKDDLDFFQQIYFHKIGSETKSDTYSIGKDFPRIAEIKLESSFDGKTILAKVANGDGGEFAHYVLFPDGKWVQLTQFQDKIKQAALGYHNDIYLASYKDAPKGKLLHMDLSEPQLAKAKAVTPEGEGVITDILPTKDTLYVNNMVGGPSEIRVYGLDGKFKKKLPILPFADVDNISKAANGGLAFRVQSYTEPAAWYEFQPKTPGKVHKTAMVKKSPVSFSDVVVERDVAVSKDGTKVPLTILHKKGVKKDGKNPTVLYGYGGYGISMSPRFRADTHLWLEHGGIYAVANLRGGGEFGENWHKSGNLTKKQNVFDDFIACAEHLIQAKYTSKDHLAIEGGSNGGLLMGAVLTQRPDLFHAVVSHVGIYDMLRVETDSNGAFNVTEFGTVKDPAQFTALFAYSPYHHIDSEKKYPAVLLLTGANDGRVNPYHSKKMAARLQSLKQEQPVLLRVTFDGGHGIGSSVKQRVAEESDVFAFLFQELGVKY